MPECAEIILSEEYADFIGRYSTSREEVKKMTAKIFDSEIKLMEIIWENEEESAKNISLIAKERIGWNKNTTYTILKKLEAKGYISREDPGFVCRSLVSAKEIQQSETKGLIDKLFKGSRTALFSSLLSDESVSDEEIEELRRMIDGR